MSLVESKHLFASAPRLPKALTKSSTGGAPSDPFARTRLASRTLRALPQGSFAHAVDLSGPCWGDLNREADHEMLAVQSSGTDAWGDFVE